MEVNAKLEAYRTKKKTEHQAEQRRSRIWEILTFQFLVRSNSKPVTKSQQTDHDVNIADLEVISDDIKTIDEEEEDTAKPWTLIDFAIVFVKILMWGVGQWGFVKVGFGAVYFTTSCFAFMWLNLGTAKRKNNSAPSAYSVFNPNCEKIQGTFDADQIEDQLRHRKPLI